METTLPYPLYWAGDSLEFTFTGGELRVTLAAEFGELEPWIAAELDGAPILRMPLDRGETEIRLLRGLAPGGARRIRIFLETQPAAGGPRCRLAVTGLRGIGGEVIPTPPRGLFLEFIGDSLTSGEGLAGAREETEWIAPLFSASQGWARRTADLLGADFRAVSQSGWGVCSGWDGDADHVLPRWYGETRPLRPREPDAILINLGTNDDSAIQFGLSPVGPEGFEEAALDFLRRLRAEHPAARLVWAYGMLGDGLRPQLEGAVRRFGDALYLPLPAVTEETMGSRQHPGPVCHRQAAEAAAGLLRGILPSTGNGLSTGIAPAIQRKM